MVGGEEGFEKRKRSPGLFLSLPSFFRTGECLRNKGGALVCTRLFKRPAKVLDD